MEQKDLGFATVKARMVADHVTDLVEKGVDNPALHTCIEALLIRHYVLTTIDVDVAAQIEAIFKDIDGDPEYLGCAAQYLGRAAQSHHLPETA